jgi:excisionase family DNA binding protein
MKLTTQQVAERLGVHRSRVHALIREGRMPVERFGSLYMIDEDDLNRLEIKRVGRPAKKDDAEKAAA